MKDYNKYIELLSARRLLRKHVIERLVTVLSVLLILVTLLMIGTTARRITAGAKKTNAAMGDFRASLAPALDVLTKTPAPENKASDYAPIVNRGIFGYIGVPPTPKPESSQKTTSTLPFTLIGTFLTSGQEPYAIIEEQKKKAQDVFLLNDMVFGEAKLVAIFPDHVDVSRNNKIETLYLDTGAAERSAPETQGGVAMIGVDEYVVEEGELDKALENLPLLLTQARAVPYFKDGRAVGLRLFAIKTGSLFEKIGLQNGDVLKAVNGNSLADLSQAMQLFQKLKEEKSIAVAMERNGMEKEFKYQIR